MKQLLIPLRKVIAIFLTFYFFLATLSVRSDNIAPLDEERLRLHLTVISDIHTEGNNIPRFKINARSLKNLGSVKDVTDALVLLGDNTMNGQAGESLLCYGMLETVNPIKPYYTAMGNHDVGNGDESNGSFEKLRERQLGYLQAFVDKDLEELYYSKTVNGYSLIIPAPDSEESAARTLSDKQLDWLEAQLDAAAETGKPIFVFNHYPASRIGQGHDRYAALVTKYPNTFVIVGHMHYYIRFGRLYGAHVTPEIWVPCLSMMDENGEANDKTGLGYLLEVYDDEVVFRGMNFYEGRLTDVEQRYALQTPQAEEPEIPPAIGF
ncbi:MAG: metallophosphoesterase [Clostridia bacterium]|nr:metallophosphoesterase [Clostridia bacterium]MBQ4365462.1 metallophosphoesterase [Clostridia bacterium]MBR3095379.1 metallophosphoesterase [Clostridia bacterium]